MQTPDAMTGMIANPDSGVRVDVAQGLYVENNDWAARSAYRLRKQTVYHRPVGDAKTPLFGWAWEYPRQEGMDAVGGYPEVIFGQKPWSDFSTDPRLPVPLKDVHSLTVDYDAEVTATGKWNLAFDLWVCRAISACGPEDITHEVMVWADSGGSPSPAGDPRDYPPHLLGTSPADYWSCGKGFFNGVWDYHAFQFRQPQRAGRVNLGVYLHALVLLCALPEDGLLASVEFGNEVWDGSGHTAVNKYDVTLETGR